MFFFYKCIHCFFDIDIFIVIEKNVIIGGFSLMFYVQLALGETSGEGDTNGVNCEVMVK